MENNLEKEFVSYEQAVALKELGFNEICMGYFDVRLEHQIGNFDFTEIKGYRASTGALSPLKQQVFRWFRVKYDLFSFVFIFDEGFGYETFKEGVSHINDFDTYEDAENAAIDELIELAKQQDK